MDELKRRNWSKDETILAFDLYCRTPFGQIGKTNPEIIKLARLIGRTPSAVALKMSNLAHYDPKLRARNVKGMEHGSLLDSIVFEEFNSNLGDLSYQAQLIKGKYDPSENAWKLEINDYDDIPPGKYRDRLIKTRVGQYAFRQAILNSYHQKCCVTGLAITRMLVASHIKPWNVSDEETERTNPRNGLCLNSFHDRAFDQGFITIDRNYRIVLSDQLKKAGMDESTMNWFKCYEGRVINLPDKFTPGKQFIEYHNDVIFRS